MSAVDPGGAPENVATPEPASSGPDLSGFNDRLDQIGGQVGDLVGQWQNFMQSQQPQEPEVDPWAGLFGTEEPQQQDYPVAPQQPQLTPEALQNAFSQALQQANGPLAQQIQQMQQQMAVNQLLTDIPQLQDPEVARSTEDYMARHLQGVPQNVAQAIANNPALVGIFFKAAEAEKLAGAQEPAGEATPQLETAGGAHPGGSGEEQNIVHRVYANRPAVPKGFM